MSTTVELVGVVVLVALAWPLLIVALLEVLRIVTDRLDDGTWLSHSMSDEDDEDNFAVVEPTWYECDHDGCDARYLTKRQLRAHQAKHSLRYKDDEDES